MVKTGTFGLLVMQEGYRYESTNYGIESYVKDNVRLHVQPKSWRRIELNNGSSRFYDGLHMGLTIDGRIMEDSGVGSVAELVEIEKKYLAELAKVQRRIEEELAQYGINLRFMSRVAPNGDGFRIPEIVLEYPIGTDKKAISKAVLTTQKELVDLMLRYVT